MSSPDRRQLLALAAAFAAPLALAGCFQPIYAERPGQINMRDRLTQIEIAPIQGRFGQEIRNALIFAFYGGAEHPKAAPYQLRITTRVTELSAVVDPSSGRPAAINYSVDAVYQLVDTRTKAVVHDGTAISRAVYDTISQRFANYRARRDIEDRAAQLLAEQIQTKLVAYFLTRG